MKAAVLHEYDQPLRIESIELADPRPDEVIVRLAASGVCHTDLSVQRGKLPLPPPCVLGHEGAGVVEDVGSGVTHLKPGDHVVLSWVQNCGRCPYCVAGRHHLCEGAILDAILGEDLVYRRAGQGLGRLAGVGSFAERTVVRASAAVKIPDAVPLDAACLIGCGVMTGVGAAINTVRIEPGQTVAVFGCGGVGLNVIQGAALASPSRIIAIDVLPQKLALAAEFGATDTIDAHNAGDVRAAIKDLTGGLGVDYAFEVTGLPNVILDAFLAVMRGGTAVVVGAPGFAEEVTIPAALFALEERSIVGSLYGGANMRHDMPRLADLYLRGRLKLDELISRRIRLEEVNEAFAAIENGGVARSVIVYD